MCTRPPTTIVGSKPASVRTIPVSDVVVVLPCVPATRDALLQAHDLAEHLGPPDHGDAPRAGGGDLGVRLRHGRGDDEQVGVLRRAPDRGRSRSSRPASPAARCISERARSQPEISRGVASRRISAMPLMPTPPAPTKWRRRSRRNLTRRVSASKSSVASSRAASGLRERPRLLAHLDELGAVASSCSVTVPARFSAVRSFSSITTAAPAASSARAFSSWWPGGRGGERDEDRRAARPRRARRRSSRRRGRPRGRPTPSARRASAGTGTIFQCAGIRAIALARRGEVLVPGLVDRPRCPLLEEHGRARHRAVDDARALASAEDEQRAASSRRGRAAGSRRTRAARASRSRSPARLAGARSRRRGPAAVRVAKRLRNRLATPGHRVRLVDERRDPERARGQ